MLSQVEISALNRRSAWQARNVPRDDWLVGGDRRAVAAERIYVVATELIAQRGWESFDIDALAVRAHCSRATIYRHVGGKVEIRNGVLMRVAARIVGTVRRAVVGMTGSDRVVTAVAVALEEIRSDPLGQLMISRSTVPAVNGIEASPALASFAAELTGIAADDPLAAQWIVRLVMSFAYLPVGDSTVERKMLQRFVAPAFANS
jgi:AcrR family transcriptional regulator